MKRKLVYLTTNPHKANEAKTFLKEKYNFDLEIVNPDFDIIEIQAKTCAEVAGFSAKYAAEKLGCEVLKSDSGLYLDALGGLPGPYNAYLINCIGADTFFICINNIKTIVCCYPEVTVITEAKVMLTLFII